MAAATTVNANSVLDESDDDADATGRRLQAWERAYEADRSWEELEEDESGRLRALDPTANQRAKRRRLLDAAASARIRRGMIRYCVVVIDLSNAVNETDLRPSRLALISTLVPAFIRAFFGANPLSQLGLMVARNGVAERLTDLSGAPEAHVAALAAALRMDGNGGGGGAAGGASAAPVFGGDFSLQNALDQAVASLKGIPPYGTRELLLLQSALATCDPGNIHASTAAAKAARLRVSVIGLSAEMHVARRLTEETGGVYGVALCESHLEELILAHAPPPPALAESTAASLVQMGFPQRARVEASTYFCAGTGGDFVCPRCKGRLAELPGECPVCRLTLVSSPHLARSYHHLFPVAPYEEVLAPSGDGADAAAPPPLCDAACFGCGEPLRGEGGGGADAAGGVVLRCPRCAKCFCFRCDSYVHEALHNCPGCECAAEA